MELTPRQDDLRSVSHIGVSGLFWLPKVVLRRSMTRYLPVVEIAWHSANMFAISEPEISFQICHSFQLAEKGALRPSLITKSSLPLKRYTILDDPLSDNNEPILASISASDIIPDILNFGSSLRCFYYSMAFLPRRYAGRQHASERPLLPWPLKSKRLTTEPKMAGLGMSDRPQFGRKWQKLGRKLPHCRPRHAIIGQ